MDSLALIITIALIYIGRKIYIEAKVNSYDLDKVSIGKMAMDAGKSPSQIKSKMASGGYDKDSKWKI